MNSWRTKIIGELVEYEQPSKYLVKSTDYIASGTPVLTANKAFILGYTNETEGIYCADKITPVIIFDDFTTDNKYVDFDFKVKSSAIKILTAKPEEALPEFVHGVMQLIKTEITEHKRRFISEYQFNPVDVPELPEQARIVSILKVWDEYIKKLEQKIALKEQLKKGLMQQLLTGKRQLTGYSSKWRDTKLKDICDDFMVPMRDKPKNLNGSTPWCRIEDFEGKYLEASKSNQGVSDDEIRRVNLKVFPKNTLIVSCSADLGRCAIAAVDLVTNQTFIGLMINKENDINFMYHLMRYSKDRLNKLSTGTTITYLSRKGFESFEVSVPKLEEQQAIAEICDTADTSVNQVKLLKNHAQNQKKYLLKNLITGTIRTPENLQPKGANS